MYLPSGGQWSVISDQLLSCADWSSPRSRKSFCRPRATDLLLRRSVLNLPFVTCAQSQVEFAVQSSSRVQRRGTAGTRPNPFVLALQQCYWALKSPTVEAGWSSHTSRPSETRESGDKSGLPVESISAKQSNLGTIVLPLCLPSFTSLPQPCADH